MSDQTNAIIDELDGDDFNSLVDSIQKLDADQIKQGDANARQSEDLRHALLEQAFAREQPIAIEEGRAFAHPWDKDMGTLAYRDKMTLQRIDETGDPNTHANGRHLPIVPEHQTKATEKEL